MSQPAAAPPPPQPAAAAAPPAPAPPATAGRRFWPAPTGKPIGAGIENTPVLLNRLQIAGVAVVLLFGLLSGLVQFLSYQSDGRAADDTEQLLRVQEIQSSLLHADALATNSFLVGGEGDPGSNLAYEEEVDNVLRLIAAASAAQPADQKALEELADVVNDYTTSVADARVYNRQQLPVGAAYLSLASGSLRADAQPIMRNLVDANVERAEDSMAGQHPVWLLLIGLATLAALVWLNLVLARRFRRYVNVGVAVAAGVVLLVTLLAVLAAFRGDGQNDDLQEEELRMAIDQAAARTAGNDAKAYESLRLINQGSGGVNEPRWQEAAAIVEERADRTIRDEWNAYAERHAEIVRYDDRDNWFRAKDIATDPGEDGVTARFDRFDQAAQALADENGSATTEALRAGRTVALVGSLLTVVLGFVAAIAIARGIGARRKEYA